MLEVTINGKLTKVPHAPVVNVLFVVFEKISFPLFLTIKILLLLIRTTMIGRLIPQTTQMKYITDQNTMVLKGHIKSIFLLH